MSRFKGYKTVTLIAITEDTGCDCFMYTDVMDELHERSKSGDLTAFQFLLQCDLNQPMENQA